MASTEQAWKDPRVREAVLEIWGGQRDKAEAIFREKKDTVARYALHYAEVCRVFRNSPFVLY